MNVVFFSKDICSHNMDHKIRNEICVQLGTIENCLFLLDTTNVIANLVVHIVRACSLTSKIYFTKYSHPHPHIHTTTWAHAHTYPYFISKL